MTDDTPQMVDITVVMAEEMLAYDEAHPEEVLAERRLIVAQLHGEGFDLDDLRLLYGDEACEGIAPSP